MQHLPKYPDPEPKPAYRLEPRETTVRGACITQAKRCKALARVKAARAAWRRTHVDYGRVANPTTTGGEENDL